MDDETRRKLTFWEACGGEVAIEGQMEFERVQKMAERHKVPVSFGIQITVYPHDDKKMRGFPHQFGEASFKIKRAPPPDFVSERYVTEVDKNGVIVGDGKTATDVIQEQLFPKELVNILKIKEVNDGEGE